MRSSSFYGWTRNVELQSVQLLLTMHHTHKLMAFRYYCFFNWQYVNKKKVTQWWKDTYAYFNFHYDNNDMNKHSEPNIKTCITFTLVISCVSSCMCLSNMHGSSLVWSLMALHLSLLYFISNLSSHSLTLPNCHRQHCWINFIYKTLTPPKSRLGLNGRW